MNRKDVLHLKAPQNWINDPNGFIFYKGQYHLFYQHFPYAPIWGTMHWGHAVSKDLVTWEHRGIALFPSCLADQNGCFSGSAIEHDGQLHLFYTGVRYESVNPENIHLCIDEQFAASQLTISSEDGEFFDNFHGKKVVIPVMTDAGISDRTHTRDPKVWWGKDAWYMILGGTDQKEKGKLLLYRSTDLNEWNYAGQVSCANLGWMCECPDYFETGEDKILIVSPIRKTKDGAMYDCNSLCMLVDFDESACSMQIPDQQRLVDYGMDLYAPQTTTDEDGRRVMIAWMRMPEAVGGKWNGMFCMPRVVEVKDQHIYFRLHPHLKRAFSKKIADIKDAHPAGYSLSLELPESQSVSIGGYVISRKDGKIHADRRKVFPKQVEEAVQFSTPVIKEGDHLDIYVEPNLVEIYVNDGEYVLSNVVYGLNSEIQSSEKIQITMYTVE